MRVLRLAACAVLAMVGASSCRTSPVGAVDDPSANASAPAAKTATGHLTFEHAPDGEVTVVVQTAVTHAQEQGRRIVVYEGASWCEPCQNFHAAVARGELDAQFPNLTLLEFDADHDRDRLVAAGYGSQYIPLFALPGKDGRAAGPKAQGGIKGDTVVPYLTKKLHDLLAQGT